MNTDYSKYLSAKLYLIESISLRGMLAGDEKMKEIHNICLAPPKEIFNRINNLSLNKA